MMYSLNATCEYTTIKMMSLTKVILNKERRDKNENIQYDYIKFRNREN